MPLKFNKYLIDLRRNAIRYEHFDINGKENKKFFRRHLSQVICYSISILFLLLLKNGFSDGFVSYVSTVLSILIGLFISAIIFSFDKFHKSPNKENKLFKISINKSGQDVISKDYEIALSDMTQLNAKEKLWNTQSFNYAKQFAYLIGYSIVLSIFTISLLSLSALFKEEMAKNFHNYFFDFRNISWSKIFLFLQLTFIGLQRILVVYWVSRIIYYTIYAVSSMVNFMAVKLNRENDTN